MTTTEFNEADLPELPEEFRRCSEGGTAEYLDQIAGGASRDDAQRLIRAFALAAVAASRKKLMEQPAVAYRSSEQYSPDVGSWFEYYDQYREINDTSGLTPLFITPMPQASGKAVPSNEEIQDTKENLSD